MRPRISIRGCVRQSIGLSIRPFVTHFFLIKKKNKNVLEKLENTHEDASLYPQPQVLVFQIFCKFFALQSHFTWIKCKKKVITQSFLNKKEIRLQIWNLQMKGFQTKPIPAL